MSETKDYAPLLPVKPPEGLFDWLRGRGKLCSHSIIYKAAWVADPLSGEKERMVQLRCSACGGTMYAQRVDSGGCRGGYSRAPFGYFDPGSNESVISGNDVLCPMCGSAVRAVHVGDFRTEITREDHYTMTVHRVEEALALLGWCVRLTVDGEGREHLTAVPYEGYVFEEKKAVRLVGYHKCITTLRLLGCWEQRKQCIDNWGKADLIYPFAPELLVGSTVENSKLDLFLQQAVDPYPVQYLRIWQKYRNAENLVVQGVGNLLNDLIKYECTRNSYERPKGVPKLQGVNWKEARPAQMLGLTKSELRRCREEGWNKRELELFRSARKELREPGSMALCRQVGIWQCEYLVKDGEPLLKTVRYLLRQKERNGRADWGVLSDYWRIARAEGVDLRDPYNHLPPDLMKAHDRVVAIHRERVAARKAAERAAENEKLRSQFAARLEELRKFAWEQDGILIRPAEQPEELEREGEILHHCVGTYRSKHAEGRSAIFFLRRVEAPDKPWYTLELSGDLRVLQNRGKANCARTKEIEAFEAAWLEHIQTIKTATKKKKGTTAA